MYHVAALRQCHNDLAPSSVAHANVAAVEHFWILLVQDRTVFFTLSLGVQSEQFAKKLLQHWLKDPVVRIRSPCASTAESVEFPVEVARMRSELASTTINRAASKARPSTGVCIGIVPNVWIYGSLRCQLLEAGIAERQALIHAPVFCQASKFSCCNYRLYIPLYTPK